MQILDTVQIKQKIERLAYQIYEHNYDQKAIILAGINNNGMAFGKLLAEKIQAISDLKVSLTQIHLNPAKPQSSEVSINMDGLDLKSSNVIIVDDVANTGRTIFYACHPLFDQEVKKIEVAVLVDRMHKNFPIKVDYIGLSLATTLKENIRVDLSQYPDMSAHLE